MKTFFNHYNVRKLLRINVLILLIMSFSITSFNGNPYFITNCVMAAENTNKILAAKGSGIVILKDDGTVAVGGTNQSNQYDARNWTNIKSVYKYLDNIYGLTTDGKVKSTKRGKYASILDTWTDLDMLCMKNDFMGLRSDGRVYSTYAQSGVENWRNIVYIAHGLGLKSDGTIEMAKALYTSPTYASDIKGWRDIIKIVAFNSYGDGAIGLKKDGTLVYSGSYFNKNASLRKIADWKDIVDIDIPNIHRIVGLTKNGTVLVAGKSYVEGKLMNRVDISTFTDIKAISAAEYFLVGIKNDGSIVAAGSTWNNNDDISLYVDSIE